MFAKYHNLLQNKLKTLHKNHAETKPELEIYFHKFKRNVNQKTFADIL